MKYTFSDLDERIIKTRIALSNAIFEILKLNNNVKVLDVCKKANITPMTYYHHFNNKQHLLEFAIKQQLENKLPIPIKLKPQNLRQLIAYLIQIYAKFVRENYEIIISSVRRIYDQSFNHSYLQILLALNYQFVYREIKRIYANISDQIIIIWTTILSYGLIFLFIRNIKYIKNYQYETVWNSMKLLWNKI